MFSGETTNRNSHQSYLKVFLAPKGEIGENGNPKFTTALPPICSNPVFNKHAENLKIIDICPNESFVQGGTKVVVLTEKLPKAEDIVIRFSDQDSGWEDFVRIETSNIHKQYALTMKCPAFADSSINVRKKVNIELIKPGDNCSSEPFDFFYLPLLKSGN